MSPLRHNNYDHTTYLGTETRELCYYGWDNSVKTPEVRDVERLYQFDRYWTSDKMKPVTSRIVK